MARPCNVCEHPELTAINRAWVDSAADSQSKAERYRRIGMVYKLHPDCLRRHVDKHLTKGLAKAVARHSELIQETKQLDVMAKLGALVGKAEAMLEAADAWLRDPEDPTRYTLGPREHEVWVIWEREVESGGRVRTERKRERLTDILNRCAEKSPSAPRVSEVTMVEFKSADPRKLLLEAVSTLKPVLELLGKAYGQIQEKQPQITQAVQVVLRLEPDQRPLGVVIEGDR